MQKNSGNQPGRMLRCATAVVVPITLAIAAGEANAGLFGRAAKAFSKGSGNEVPVHARNVPLSAAADARLATEAEVRRFFGDTTREILEKRPSLIGQDEFRQIFKKYPDLADAMKAPDSYRAFIRDNPRFLEDASVELYSKRPELFAEGAESAHVALDKNALQAAVRRSVSGQNADAVRQLLSRVKASLEKKGISPDKLDHMDEVVLDRLIDKAVNQEIDALVKVSSYKWQYKSGTLSVTGEVGHITFDQEISFRGLVKTALLGFALYTGYDWYAGASDDRKRSPDAKVPATVIWDKDDFELFRECVGDFCLHLGGKRVRRIEAVEPVRGIEVTGTRETGIGSMKFETGADKPASERASTVSSAASLAGRLR